MEDWLTVAQVARELDVTTQAVYRLIDRGSLAAAIKVGRKCVKRSAVQELKERESYKLQSEGRRGVDRQHELPLEGVNDCA